MFSWGDGRPLAALIGKFRSNLVDYLALCAEGNPETMLQKIFAVVESEFCIKRPCKNHTEWICLNEAKLVEYLSQIVNSLSMDRDFFIGKITTSPRLSSNGISVILMPRKRSLTNKTSFQNKYKKSQQITERAENLVNSMASTLVKENNLVKENESLRNNQTNNEKYKGNFNVFFFNGN